MRCRRSNCILIELVPDNGVNASIKDLRSHPIVKMFQFGLEPSLAHLISYTLARYHLSDNAPALITPLAGQSLESKWRPNKCVACFSCRQMFVEKRRNINKCGTCWNPMIASNRPHIPILSAWKSIGRNIENIREISRRIILFIIVASARSSCVRYISISSNLLVWLDTGHCRRSLYCPVCLLCRSNGPHRHVASRRTRETSAQAHTDIKRLSWASFIVFVRHKY